MGFTVSRSIKSVKNGSRNIFNARSSSIQSDRDTRIMLRTPSKHVIQTIICLILVYLSWGSSFIGIKFGLTSFPPFLLIGIRMLLAGIILFTLIWMRGERNIPTLQDFRHTFVLAIYMVFIASGFLAKGQETVSSGTAAMILGTTPIWMVLGGWLIWKEKRPTPIQFAGLGGGFFGLVLLSVNQGISGESSLLGILLVLSAPLAWVVGSFYSKKHARETRLSVHPEQQSAHGRRGHPVSGCLHRSW